MAARGHHISISISQFVPAALRKRQVHHLCKASAARALPACFSVVARFVPRYPMAADQTGTG